MKLLADFFNLPSKLWGLAFPPKIHPADEIVIVSSDRNQLQNIAQMFGEHSNVKFFMNPSITLNEKTIHLDNDEAAIISVQHRWWTKKPAVTVTILRK